jgi:lipopolysaccharide transport system permease protein
VNSGQSVPNRPARHLAASLSREAQTLPSIVILPPAGWVRLELGELWRYRDLLRFLVLRDLRIRYKQTVIGSAWAILQPLLTMVVLNLFFARLVRPAVESVPYPVFAYSALVPWTYFMHALTKAVSSVSDERTMVTSVYFPRLLLPLAAVLAGLADFVIAFVVLLLLMRYYGLVPTVAVLSLPLFTLLAVATALGVGLWLAALNVEYRDVANAVPFLIQLWLLATPVAYPSSLIPGPWRPLYGLNPMAGVVEGFRWALLGSAAQPPGPMLAVSACVVLALLISGVYFFRWREQDFADVV